jgi:spore maturation protein CgeB
VDPTRADGSQLHIVVSYRGVPQAHGYETGASLATAFRRLGHSVYEYGNYYQSTQRIQPEPPPQTADLLVWCECNDADPQYWELESYPASRKAYWDFDTATHSEMTKKIIDHVRFDAVFYANRNFTRFLSALHNNTTLLPYAFNDEIHRPLPNVTKTVDVGLIGSPYPKRVALIKKLRKTGINAELVSGVYGEDMVRTVNSFKIQLNYLVGGGRGLLNARVFETVGCGTLLLNENEDGIEDCFKDGGHVVLYHSESTCVEKVRFLLSHEDVLQSIARNGHEYGLKFHTYLQRANTILEKTFSHAGSQGQPN